ncbi:hypothetical protein NXV73_15900 [Bacteroides salyersiae]|nr:hypothetical protein [Bacteroides salyersiae]
MMSGIRKNVSSGAFRSKSSGKPKPTGKRIGKSKPAKANNQLNRESEIILDRGPKQVFLRFILWVQFVSYG